MNGINELVFQKANAQDDKGLEDEAKSLLVRVLTCSGYFRLLTSDDVEWEVRHPRSRVLQGKVPGFKHRTSGSDTR